MSAIFKKCTKCTESKPVDKFHKRSASVDGLSPVCKSCKKMADKIYQAKNKEKISLSSKLYRENNKEKFLRSMAESYRKNKAAYKQKAKEWGERNPDKVKGYKDKYRENNKHKVNYWAASRRAEKRLRTPVWGQDGIEGVYILSKWLNMATIGYSGRGKFQSWHVDHVLPISGEHVSGLHVLGNLQIIPASVNIVKRNFYNVG